MSLTVDAGSVRITVAYCVKRVRFPYLGNDKDGREAGTQRVHVIEEDSPSSVYAPGENLEEVSISCKLASLTLAIASFFFVTGSVNCE